MTAGGGTMFAGRRVVLSTDRDLERPFVRSKVQKISPMRANEMLAANSGNRPLTKGKVREFAAAMRRGEWLVTHQGIAFDVNGTLVDGQHRLAAIVEANLPIELTVFTAVPDGTFDVLDTGKRRNAADVLAIDGEKSATMLAAMVRTVLLYRSRPDMNWSGGSAAVTNHQIVQGLADNPKLRDYTAMGDQVAAATGMIKSAAGAASYLVAQANKKSNLEPWFDGIVEGAGLAKGAPQLVFRRVMLADARKKAGQGLRRRDTREHVALYVQAFNAWITAEPLTHLRFAPRDTMPAIATA